MKLKNVIQEGHVYMRLRSHSIGESIKRIRIEKRLTQRELAKILNLPASAISDYESDKQNISLDRFFQICEALSTDPREMLKIF